MSVGNAGCKELILCILHPKRRIITSVTGASTVHFKVCFIKHVDSELVAKQIEFGTVGIVRGSDCVDVQLLHQVNVLSHILKAYGCCGLAVEVMAVNTLELNCYAVNLKYFTVDGYLAEADLFLDLLSICIEVKSVELGILGSPRTNAINGKSCTIANLGNNLGLTDDATDIHVTHIDHGNGTVLTIDLGFKLVIGNMLFGTGEHIYVSENTRETEFILTLKVGGDTPFENENVKRVLTVLHKLGNVKLTGCVRDLRVTLELSVYVEIKCGVNTFKVDIVLFAGGLFQVEGAAVMPAGILIRKVRKHNRERISDIEILNMVIAVHLNTRGNGDSVLKLFVDLKILNVVVLLDLPYTVKRGETGAGCTVLNAVLGSDHVIFCKRDVVASMRGCTNSFESFVLFHFVPPYTFP